MTIADQVLAYLRVLVWPVIVAMAIVLFREPIRGLLNGLEQFEGFGVKATIRRRVDQAVTRSQIALSNSPIERKGNASVNAFVISYQMEVALRAGQDLVRVGKITEAELLPWMRRVFEQLDAALIAVLVATVVPAGRAQQAHEPVAEAAEPGAREQQEVPSPTNSFPALADPAGVEIYMIDLTGLAGWRGVVEARGILKDALDSICGKKAEALTPTDATNFFTAVSEAIGRLSALVDLLVNLASRRAVPHAAVPPPDPFPPNAAI